MAHNTENIQEMGRVLALLQEIKKEILFGKIGEDLLTSVGLEIPETTELEILKGLAFLDLAYLTFKTATQ